jgi:hypothetical protein
VLRGQIKAPRFDVFRFKGLNLNNMQQRCQKWKAAMSRADLPDKSLLAGAAWQA